MRADASIDVAVADAAASDAPEAVGPAPENVAAVSPAPTVRTFQSTGNSANRVDMVFLGDGYTTSQIATSYTTHVNNYINYIFDGTTLTDPFTRYRNFFNIHVIDVVSNQSGADIPNPGNPAAAVTRDTALDAKYYYDGVTERLLYIDNAKADAAADTALAGAGFTSEMRYVTVNETKYGGGGGNYAVYAGGNSSALEVALHEVGHSFASLADEYGGTAGPYTGSEPGEINATTNSTGAKWSEWLGYNDPVLGVVGAYNGGRYYDSGIYRPTQDSKMRSLDRPFDPIAREAFIHEFYKFVNPLDSHDANVGSRSNLRTLAVDTIDPAIIKVDWTVNGALFAEGGESFSLDTRNFGFGTYTVTARAYDPTPWVRGDRSDLEQSVSWTVVNDYRLVGSSAADTLSANDNAQEVLGLDGHDVLRGLGGHDTMSGGAGNDTVIGGDGADFMQGDAGDDIYAVNTGGDIVSETAGGGTDTIYSEVTYTLPAEVEAMILVGSAQLNGIGNDLTNYMYGNAGANRLEGGAGGDGLSGFGGSDTLVGGTGIDGMAGGSGDDTYAVDSIYDVILENANEGSDVVFSTVTHQLYANVEALILVGSADSWAIGNAQANFLYGNVGNNYFDGGGAADVAQGGGGNDVFRLRMFDLNGDTITDFSTGDLIQFQGYAAASSTVTALGSGLYRVSDASNGAAEVFSLSNAFTLTAANYTFV